MLTGSRFHRCCWSLLKLRLITSTSSDKITHQLFVAVEALLSPAGQQAAGHSCLWKMARVCVGSCWILQCCFECYGFHRKASVGSSTQDQLVLCRPADRKDSQNKQFSTNSLYCYEKYICQQNVIAYFLAQCCNPLTSLAEIDLIVFG